MPLKPSYLLLVGAGGIVAYSGFKGLSISSAARSLLQGQNPSQAQTANAILTASYSYGYGASSGGPPGSIPVGPNTGASGSSPASKPIGGRGSTGTGTTQTAGGTLPGHTSPGGSGGGSGTLSKAAAKALGFTMVVAAGWGSQWNDFNSVVMAESGWDTTIHNGGGHGYVPGLAYGIPQALPGDKMASAGSNWLTSSYTQIKWMIGYIRSVYGDPAHAWAHEQADHWY